jgi:uncharacterized tellurite resistance protein B-like protein
LSHPAEHPATQLPLSERVDYLVVVASMAAADGEVSAAEFEKWREFCKALELGPEETGQVMSALDYPDKVRIQDVAARLRSSELRFTLMTDLLFMAHADDEYCEAEQCEIRELSDALNVNDAQLAALEKYVLAVLKAANTEGVGSENLKKLGGDVAASLAAAGVPIAAVAVSGSVAGLSAAGITSGLAALGLGLGMTAGIGVVAGIGVASYFGVRWLYRRVAGA